MTSDQRDGRIIRLKTPRSVHREREEREEAEREGRQMVEEELEDENIPSPFQPISSVISEVCVCVCDLCVQTSRDVVLQTSSFSKSLSKKKCR